MLGSERHESRRIDNQLRGRSGRQGDPGESRFFLSLEDELMRLFATGAMQWVMGRTLPDDVPIEAKMVTKAIERAQHTVEGRNAEIRKDVLKYDEVLNEQRKVIYARRLQVIDGEDLREHTEELLEQTIDELVRSACPGEFPEAWELERLLAEVTQYYPTGFTVEDLAEAVTASQIAESLLAEALDAYHARDAAFPGGEDEARGRRARGDDADHRPALARPPGRDGLPARGDQPPGHGPAGPAGGVAARGVLDLRPDDGRHRRRLPPLRHARPGGGRARPRARSLPRQLPGRRRPGPGGEPPRGHAGRPRPAEVAAAGAGVPAGMDMGGMPVPGGQVSPRHQADEETQAPLVKAPTEKLGRNEPCWCGSGKKFKLCHGAV